MKSKQNKYQDIPEWGAVEELAEVSSGFLPKPENLIFKPRLKKVTIVLDEDSVNFFKEKADELNTSYQRMIRTLLDTYAKKMKLRNRTD